MFSLLWKAPLVVTVCTVAVGAQIIEVIVTGGEV